MWGGTDTCACYMTARALTARTDRYAALCAVPAVKQKAKGPKCCRPLCGAARIGRARNALRCPHDISPPYPPRSPIPPCTTPHRPHNRAVVRGDTVRQFLLADVTRGGGHPDRRSTARSHCMPCLGHVSLSLSLSSDRWSVSYCGGWEPSLRRQRRRSSFWLSLSACFLG